MSWEHDLWYFYTKLTIYDIFEVLVHTIVISRKTVKWAENTICDTVHSTPGDMTFLKVFTHTVVTSRKTVNWAEEHDLWYLWTELTEIWFLKFYRMQL